MLTIKDTIEIKKGSLKYIANLGQLSKKEMKITLTSKINSDFQDTRHKMKAHKTVRSRHSHCIEIHKYIYTYNQCLKKNNNININ